MTLFGIVWILFLLYFIFRQDLEKIIFMTLLSAVFQCNNVILINGSGIGPFIISSIVLLLYYTFFMKKRLTFSRRFDFVFISQLLVFAAVIISVILNKNTFDSKNIIRIIQLLVYILTFNVIRNIFNYRKYDYKKMLVYIIDFVLIIGIFQFLCSLNVIPRNFIFNAFIYNDINNSNIAYYTTLRIRLFSTFMEPSYCAAFLIFAFCFSISSFKMNRNNWIRIISIVAEICLTFSTTAYIGFLISVLILLLFTNSKKKIAKLFPIFIIGIIILLLSGQVNDVVINKASTASALTRETWNRLALANFKSSPIYGVGYKSSRASSLFYQLLGEIGTIGFLSYCVYVISVLKRVTIHDRFADKGIVAAMLSIICCQIIAIPDLDFCVFWFVMYIYAMQFYKGFERKELVINEKI